jgi:fatty acid desaturase
MNDIYLKRRPDIISLLLVFLHILAVVSALYVGTIVKNPVMLIVLWFYFGVSVHGIFLLMHECAHYLVFKNKIGSIMLGKYILGPFLFADFDGYRERHWEHHRHLGDDDDTKDAYLNNIQGANLFKMLFRSLFLFEAFKIFNKQFKSFGKPRESKKPFPWGLIILFQGLFLISLLFFSYTITHSFSIALKQTLISYYFIYIYGLMSLTSFMNNLRSIAEHQLHELHTTQHGRASLRNFKCNLVSRFLLGGYGFGEHYTHHEVPGIPYYNLPKATQEFAEQNQTFKPRYGYFQTLYKIINEKTSDL